MIPRQALSECADPEGLGQLISQYADVLRERDLPEVHRPTMCRDVRWLTPTPEDIAESESSGSLKASERIAASTGLGQLLGALSHEQQSVVFSEYVTVARGVYERAIAAGHPAYLLTGRSTGRKQIVADFRDCPNGVLIGTRVLETGLNLQTSPLFTRSERHGLPPANYSAKGGSDASEVSIRRSRTPTCWQTCQVNGPVGTRSLASSPLPKPSWNSFASPQPARLI